MISGLKTTTLVLEKQKADLPPRIAGNDSGLGVYRYGRTEDRSGYQQKID